jgi:hypothetical protein
MGRANVQSIMGGVKTNVINQLRKPTASTLPSTPVITKPATKPKAKKRRSNSPFVDL